MQPLRHPCVLTSFMHREPHEVRALLRLALLPCEYVEALGGVQAWRRCTFGEEPRFF
jgi:hypothetical protein